MTRKLVLVSHGQYASGVLSALKILFGETSQVSALDCYMSADFALQKAAQKIIQDNDTGDLIIVTDIFGGSVNNEFMKYMAGNVYLVAGMNLPFLLELMTKFDTDLSTTDLIEAAISGAKDSLKFCNKIKSDAVTDDDDF